MATQYANWSQNIPYDHKIYQMATKYTRWPQNIPDGHKIYQMATKYTKWPQNIPNGHKIYQMATKYANGPQNIPNDHKMNRHLPLQDPTKSEHLAPLVHVSGLTFRTRVARYFLMNIPKTRINMPFHHKNTKCPFIIPTSFIARHAANVTFKSLPTANKL
jgi:hypothetical protein